MASRKKDDELKEIFRSHNKKIWAVSSAMVVELGRDMLELFNQNDAISDELGFSAEQRLETGQQLEEFNELLFSTQSRLDDRRENKSDINQQIKAINALLRDELDRFVRFCRSSHPNIYTAYMRLRRKSRNEPDSSITKDTTNEDTVYDTQTQVPVSETVVELIEQKLKSTKDDQVKFTPYGLTAKEPYLAYQTSTYPPNTHYLNNIDKQQPLLKNFALSPGG